jgi:branched-chain amino acid transport system permease protein
MSVIAQTGTRSGAVPGRADRPSPLVTRAGLARGGGLVAVLVAAPLLLSANWVVNLLFFTVLYAAMSVAWNLIGGYAGYPSLGHAAFFGLGAYATADLFGSSHVLHSGYEPFLLLPVIGAAVGILALPIGAVAMRTRKDVFAIVTITLLFVVQTLAFNLKSVTGGAQGAGLAPPPFPVETFNRPFYYAAAALLLLAMLISYGASRSKIGLALSAIRGDEDKARGLGVPTLGVKLLAFAVSVGLMAVAGGIWAYYIGFVYPQFAVDPLITIAIVLMTFLGGRATLWGPVLGAAILMPAQQLLAYYIGGSRLYLVGYAAVFLVIMLLLPRGIVPTLAHRRRLAGLAARRAAAAAGAGTSVTAADADQPVADELLMTRTGGGSA